MRPSLTAPASPAALISRMLPADIPGPLHLPFQRHPTLPQNSHSATAPSTGSQTPWASDCPGGLMKTKGASPHCQFPLGRSGGRLIIWGSHKCPSLDANGLEHTWRTTAGSRCLHSKYAPFKSHRPRQTASPVEWTVLFARVYYSWICQEMEGRSVRTPTLPHQNKAHLPWALKGAGLVPPTFIPAASFYLSAHRWSGLCVCLYVSSLTCLHVHICVSPSPPLNYKVLECLSL